MRNIEEKIIQALRGWNGEGLKNLSCRDSVKVDGNTRKYYLWNSLLFWNDSENIYYFSGRGWSSGTTKSRLNQVLRSFLMLEYTKKLGLVLRLERQEIPY